MAKLFFYYSTMNAGKSTSLLQAAHNYDERGMLSLIFTLDSGDGKPARVSKPPPCGHHSETITHGNSLCR